MGANPRRLQATGSAGHAAAGGGIQASLSSAKVTVARDVGLAGSPSRRNDLVD